MEGEQKKELEGGGLLRVREAADFLAVSRGMLYKLMDSGELPYVRIGRARRIPKTSLQQFMDENMVGGTGSPTPANEQ